MNVTLGRYWIATIAANKDGQLWAPSPSIINGSKITFITGQQEIGEGGFVHWQIYIYCQSAIRLNGLKLLLCDWAHLEKTRSNAAEAYCLKEDTRVEGTQFEYGTKPKAMKSKVDWDDIRQLAIEGRFPEIDSDVTIRYYNSLTRLHKDNLKEKFRPDGIVNVFWGTTGSGKSYKAFQDAGELYYRKASTTKWWDSYQGQENIIIDEFDGKSINIVLLLQWLDPYPMQVETKGSSLVLAGRNWWITSNIDPRDWYPEATRAQRDALHRRFTQGQSKITHFEIPFTQRMRQEAIVQGEIANREAEAVLFLENLFDI
nr:MAG: replication associated protein [Cressdnaviricota sp.]